MHQNGKQMTLVLISQDRPISLNFLMEILFPLSFLTVNKTSNIGDGLGALNWHQNAYKHEINDYWIAKIN